jgi:ribonuclease BN (tRNA processing enzyme)
MTASSRITILGSGTCVPSLERNPCSFLMQTGKDNLLFDCGPGVMRRLLEAGSSIFNISHLFISHFHPDHCGELVSFLFGLKYPSPPPQRRHLTIVAGKGFAAFFEGLKSVYGPWIELPPNCLTIVEMDTGAPDRRAFSSFSVSSMPVAHRPESLAFRVADAAGKVLVYSGDTDVCDSLVTIADKADLMICESAFPDDHKVDGHLTPSLAGRIAQSAGVKRLVLTHFYPDCEDTDIENQCRSTYNGLLVLAQDLMTFSL